MPLTPEEHAARYDAAFRRRRTELRKQLEEAGAIPCHRCKQPVMWGTKWHADHADDGSGVFISHAKCNLRTSAIWRERATGKPSPATPDPNHYHWFACPPGCNA